VPSFSSFSCKKVGGESLAQGEACLVFLPFPEKKKLEENPWQSQR